MASWAADGDAGGAGAAGGGDYDQDQHGSTLDEFDYYAILNLPRDASTDDVKRAYRSLAQVFHPDKHTQDDLRAQAQVGNACRWEVDVWAMMMAG